MDTGLHIMRTYAEDFCDRLHVVLEAAAKLESGGLIAMRLARMSDTESFVKGPEEHFSGDVLWAAVKKKQPLSHDYVEHAKDCRDCREFLLEFSAEARCAGFQFPDLFPESE